MAKDIRYDLFHAIVRKDIGFFDVNKTGDLLSRMASDVQVIQMALSINITMLLRSVSIMIVTLFIIGFISW